MTVDQDTYLESLADDERIRRTLELPMSMEEVNHYIGAFFHKLSRTEKALDDALELVAIREKTISDRDFDIECMSDYTTDLRAAASELQSRLDRQKSLIAKIAKERADLEECIAVAQGRAEPVTNRDLSDEAPVKSEGEES